MVDQLQLSQEIAAALKRQEWQTAAGLLEQWSAQRPEDSRGWYNRGYCLARLGELARAGECLKRCLSIDPRAEKAEQLLRWVERQQPPRGDAAPAPPASSRDRDGAYDTVRATVSAEPAPVAPAPEAATAVHAAAEEERFPLPRTDSERVWRQGSLVAGRYEVHTVVRGGMGVVYLAYDRELERMVAVKTPLPTMLASEDGRARFLREAEAWIALGIHPNICTAYYIQEIGDVPRLFIEYVDGSDLEHLLKRNGELTIGKRLDIAIQVAGGMDYTHSFRWTDEEGHEHQGMVHRDLKPANVMVSRDGIARLTDFGLVRVEPVAAGSTAQGGRAGVLAAVGGDQELSTSWQTVTQAGGVVGTPPYMAPELWRPSQKATPAADIYAFGCMLYELFCGRRPYFLPDVVVSAPRETQLLEWLKLHIRAIPPDPAELAAGIDLALARLMVACLAKDPQQRPSSFGAVSEQLREVYQRFAAAPYPRPQPAQTRLLAASLNNRAASYLTLGSARRAESCWREALAVDPHHLEATYNLAVYEWRTRGLTDAELFRRMEEVRRDRSAGPRDHLLQGRLEQLVDRSAAAVESLRRAAADDPALEVRRELGLALLGRARASSEPALLGEAETVLAAAVAGGAVDAVTLAALVAARWQLGRRQEAEQLWERLRAQSEDLPASVEEAVVSLLPALDRRRSLPQPGQVDAIAVTPDGRLLCRSSGATVTVWDDDAATPSSTLKLGGACKKGRSIAATGDGRLAAAIDERPVGVFRLDGGPARALRPQPGYVTALAVSSDARQMLTGGSDRKLRLWDMEGGECRAALAGHEGFVSALAYLPDESRAVTASGDGTLRLWELPAGECLGVFRGHTGPVNAVAVVPGGAFLVSGGQDGTVRVWETPTARLVHTLVGHGDRVNCVAVTPDGGVALSGADDGTARFWNLAAGGPLAVLRLDRAVVDVAVHPAGGRAFVACAKTVEVVELGAQLTRHVPLALTEPVSSSEAERRERQFQGQLAAARDALASGQHRSAVTLLKAARAVPGYEQNAEALDLWGKALVVLPKEALRHVSETRCFSPHGPQIAAALFTPDGREVVAAGADGLVRVFDFATSRELHALTGHRKLVSALATSAEGLVVSAGSDGELRLWKPATGESVGVLATGTDSLGAVAVTPDGRIAVAAGADGAIRSWRLGESEKPRVLGSHREAVTALAISADGRQLVSGGWDQTVMVWNLALGTQVHMLQGHTGAVAALAVSDDCRRVASASDDGTVRLWDVQTGRCLRVLRGHTGGVSCVAISPDGRFLLTGGKDSSVRFWDLRTGASLHTVEAHTSTVSAVAFSADDRFALSAGAEGALRAWFLDWEPDLHDQVEWDERVRPLLEVFLKLHHEPGSGPPRFSEQDFGELMEDMRRRGFGWLQPDKVRGELEAMTARWGERQVAEQREVHRQHVEQLRQQRTAPVANLLSRLTHNLGVKLALLAAAVVAAVLVVQSFKVPPTTEVRFNETYRRQLARAMTQRSDQLSTRGRVVAFQGPKGRQVALDLAQFCSEQDAERYLDTILYPQNRSAETLDPARLCSDPAFQQDYVVAMNCLPQYVAPPIVEALLGGVVRRMHPDQVEDILAILVQSGARALPPLVQALSNGDVEARHVAAMALTAMGSEASLKALVEAGKGDDPLASEAAYFMIEETIVASQLKAQEAFELVKSLSYSIDSRIRSHAVAALVLFGDSEQVQQLVETALADPDSAVVETARAARERIKELRRDELLAAGDQIRTPKVGK